MTERPTRSRISRPVGGQPPPRWATLGGTTVDLEPLAATCCARYLAEFPRDTERYGEEGARAWCAHDTQYLLNWIAQDIELEQDGRHLQDQVGWLRRVLGARDFPMAQFERHLRIVTDAWVEARPDLAPRFERALLTVARRTDGS